MEARAKPVKRNARFGRVRTGCLTCREKKVKCDETKPVCGRCTRTSARCVGPGYFVDTPSCSIKHHQLPRLGRPPSQTPQLNGSAEIKDLIYLVPRILQQGIHATAINPIGSVSEYIVARGRPVGLYLDFLPSRLGHSAALDSTVDCVVTALRDLFRPIARRRPAVTFASYAQALKDLQMSLNDSGDCLSAETLCATQLMGIFESLTSQNGKTSNSHTRGTEELIRLRGPSGFTTQFERALLVSQVPVVYVTALFSAKPCFLRQPNWLAAIQSAAMVNPTNLDVSELAISKFNFMLPLPEILGACSDLYFFQDRAERAKMQQAAMEDISSVRDYLTLWHERWYDILHPSPEQQKKSFNELGSGDSFISRTSLFILHQAYSVVYTRLHIALDGHSGQSLEGTVQDLAQNITSNSLVRQYRTYRIEMAVAWAIANAALKTTEEWQSWYQSVEGLPRESPVLVSRELWFPYLQLNGVFPDISTKMPKDK